MSVLQKNAEEVAKEISPQPEGEFGIDPISIITMIIAIIQSLLGSCPKPTAAALKAPTISQQAALLLQCRSNCECLGGGFRLTGRMFRAIKAKGATLSDDDAKAIIEETSDASNLLI